MNRRLALLIALTLTISLLLIPTSAGAREIRGGDAVAPGGPSLWQTRVAPAYVTVPSMGDHFASLRMPEANTIIDKLHADGKLPLDASEEDAEAAAAEWYAKALKSAYFGPDPLAYKELMSREKALIQGQASAVDWELPTPEKSPFFVVVEFVGTDTIVRPYPDPSNPGGPCVDTEFTWGPMYLGEMTAPGPRDNHSFFKPDISIADYESVVYGEGADAPGYGVIHAAKGDVDLTGLTLQNYLLEMSRGTSRAGGGFLQTPVQVAHSHQYYGYADYETDGGVCTGEVVPVGHNTRQLPRDIVDVIVSTYGDSIDWSQYDADRDHIIDAFVIIHAGGDPAAGDSEDLIWSHSSAYIPGWDELPQVGGTTTPDDPTDDYFVSGYNQDPEQLDLGALQEEYEHQWGLPDLYVTDAENSNAWWGAHSSGVWGGELGGTRPVGHNLWQDYILGWRNPVVVNYDDPELELTIGRARYTPADTEDGLIVKLPNELQYIPNNAGDGVGAYSGSGDLLDHRVYRDFDLSSATGEVVFSFDSYWDIEEDWDYGYLQVSLDGEAWTTLADMDGVLTDTDPNGNNIGFGLTGSGQARLRFDLSGFAGNTITLRLRYLTDTAVSLPGWWVDNISLDDGTGNLYANDLESDISDLTSEGWILVPIERQNEQYYLFEWRSDNGFDVSLNDPYSFYYTDDDEDVVDTLPYTTPALTVSYRNTGRDFDYSLYDDLDAPPTTGPKYGLIVVESNFFPKRFDTLFAEVSDGWVGPSLSSRVLPGDGGFGFTPTNELTAHLGYDYSTGEWVDPPIEEKTWPSDPGVPGFHDSIGYYPGYFYPGAGGYVYYTDPDASAAMPAKDTYSTKITWPDGVAFPALYGIGIGPGGLGTGNPGDEWVQYGVHVMVVDQSDDRATIRFWNALADYDGMIKQTALTDPVVEGTMVDVEFKAQNIGGALDTVVVMPFDPDEEWVPGSEWGGATPITAAQAAALAEEKGYQELAHAASAAIDPAAIVGIGFQGFVGTGETLNFGFGVRVRSHTGMLHHSAAIFDESHFIRALFSEYMEIVPATQEVSDTLLPMADTYIRMGPDMTFGDWPFVYVGANDSLRSLVKFDLSGIDPTYPVLTATLQVYLDGYSGGGSPADLVVQALGQAWDEATATWTAPWTMPGGDVVAEAGKQSISVSSADVGQWVSVDVTGFAQHLVAAPMDDHGLLLSLEHQTSYTSYRIPSREYWLPGFEPKLDITYLVP